MYYTPPAAACITYSRLDEPRDDTGLEQERSGSEERGVLMNPCSMVNPYLPRRPCTRGFDDAGILNTPTLKTSSLGRDPRRLMELLQDLVLFLDDRLRQHGLDLL